LAVGSRSQFAVRRWQPFAVASPQFQHGKPQTNCRPETANQTANRKLPTANG
jgi:hypothetical protein